jgi:hypothetical protein
MYSFLKKYLHKHIAMLLITLWYTFLILYNLRVFFALGDGQFRYIGW